MYVGQLLSEGRWLTTLRYSIYHREILLRDRSSLYPRRTALVLLNDDDYWGPEFQARTPLKRDVLAGLVDKLNAADVATVALDVDLRSPQPDHANFEFPDYKTEDTQLLGAIARMCTALRHVVLASSITDGSDGYIQMPSVYTQALNGPSFGCVSLGYIQLPFDMRRIPGRVDVTGQGATDLDSMALAATRTVDPTASIEAGLDVGKGFRFSNYLTEDDFRERDGQKFIFSAGEIARLDVAALRSQLAGRVVFIGANWHEYAYATGPAVDRHDSPGGSEPGVMLHANYVEALLDRTGTLTPLSNRTAEVLELTLVLLLAIVGALEIASAWKWLAFLSVVLFSVVFTYTLMQNLGIFLDFLVPLAVIVAHTVVDKCLEHRQHHGPPVIAEHLS